jgi:hypothetical protein
VVALAVVVSLACVCAGWGAASYVKLLRLQVGVADACARVEAASRSRIGLVANLVHSSEAFDCLDPASRAALRAASERAARSSVVPALAVAPDAYDEFLAAQRDLSATIEEVWSEAGASPGVGSRIVIEDLQSGLERVEALLDESIAALDRSVERYRASSRRFPGSVIAGSLSRDHTGSMPGR